MITSKIEFTTYEGGVWQELQLTPGEIKLVEEHLNAITTPVHPGAIPFPEDYAFMPRGYYFSLRINSRCWDCVIGWRSCP